MLLFYGCGGGIWTSRPPCYENEKRAEITSIVSRICGICGSGRDDQVTTTVKKRRPTMLASTFAFVREFLILRGFSRNSRRQGDFFGDFSDNNCQDKWGQSAVGGIKSPNPHENTLIDIKTKATTKKDWELAILSVWKNGEFCFCRDKHKDTGICEVCLILVKLDIYGRRWWQLWMRKNLLYSTKSIGKYVMW